MTTIARTIVFLLISMLSFTWVIGKALDQPSEKERLYNEIDQLVDDDGSAETALINYLFAKQIANRLRSQMDVTELQRKRSYWKQCAFNAVSCFG
ncbi:unnamed protein product [Bemisia tabaci]|uniref:Prohormone-1 n=1 Tax=Bemisia tabaci TaxID=7038 RepID=A0A9P0CAC1_BEMTA|nr:PREDICTED: prohormone-1-like [Bemisia tabaci]XP_018909444.1 PREDICTED: prohormone-1-like [Bemisia tabaci]CAH0753099.1 unnamed protein product [Bemisia tabaci]